MSVSRTSPHMALKNASFLNKYLKSKRVSVGDVIDKPTHTSYANGSYVVSLKERKAFLQKYVHEFNGNHPEPTLFLTERYNEELFRFFVDIDYPWEYNEASSERIVDIIAHVTRAVTSMLVFTARENIENDLILVSPSKRTNHKLHIIFCNVLMHFDTCLLFAEAVRDSVTANCDYDVPIDMAPYKNGSLRMLGSCKGKADVPSDPKETDFYYTPIDRLTGEKIIETLTVETLSNHSILIPEEIHKIVDAFALSDDGEVHLKTIDELNFFVPGKFSPSAEEAEQWSKPCESMLCIGDNFVISTCIEAGSALFELLREHYDLVYAYTATSVVYNELAQCIYISFKTTKCLIAEREHRGNHPYLVISRAGSFLRCHSKKNERCSNERFKLIPFDQLDIGVKIIFWKAAFSRMHKFVPSTMWDEINAACSSMLTYFGYGRQEMTFNDGIFETTSDTKVVSPCIEHQGSPVIVQITRDGLFLVCSLCSTQYPEGTEGLITSKFRERTTLFFKMTDLYKQKGRKVFSTIEEVMIQATDAGTLTCPQAPLDVIIEGTLAERAVLLGSAFINDGLTVFTDKELNNAFIISLCGTDKDVAQFINLLLSDRYVATGVSEDSWYYFEPPRWRQDEAYSRLFKFIGEASKYYEKACDWYSTSGLNEKMKTKRSEHIINVRNKVSEVMFTKRVALRLAYLRADYRFEYKLDMKKHLLCFTDGVYDLKKHQFRQGTANDYLSMSVGYEFPELVDESMRLKLDRVFEDIVPDPEVRLYLKKFLASCIDGSTSYELFHVLGGEGRNGKSLITDLLGLALGCPETLTGDDEQSGTHAYMKTFESSFLTKERKGSSDPAPDILDYRKARSLFGTEPEASDKINSGWLKKLTGGDTIAARALNSNLMVRFKPQFKLVLVLNGYPVFTNNDKAVWNRCRMIDFPVLFTDNPDPNNPMEKLIDITLKDEIAGNPQCKACFMSMLIEWHRDLLPQGLKPPDQVQRTTQLCKEETNTYLEWWNTRTSHATTHISSQRLRDDYIAWSGESRMSTCIFNKNLKKIVKVVKSVRTQTEGTQVGVQNRKLNSEDVEMDICVDSEI